MAASEALFQELAKALSRPSKAYLAAKEGLAIPEQALQGYETGSALADKIQQRKLGRQTLSEVLGQPIPNGVGNLPISTLKTVEPALDYLGKVEKGSEDYLTPDQAKQYGLPDTFINSFGGRPIKREVVQGYASNQSRGRIAGSLEKRNELNISNAINKNVNALIATGALGQSGKNNLRIARIKPLLERSGPLTPQELERINTDIDGVITGGVPLRSTEEGQKISTIATEIARLKQSVGNSPEAFNDAAFRARIIPLVNGLIEADNELQDKAFSIAKANFGHLTTPEHLQRIKEAIANGQQLPVADFGEAQSLSDDALKAIVAGGE